MASGEASGDVARLGGAQERVEPSVEGSIFRGSRQASPQLQHWRVADPLGASSRSGFQARARRVELNSHGWNLRVRLLQLRQLLPLLLLLRQRSCREVAVGKGAQALRREGGSTGSGGGHAGKPTLHD